jgi:RES domain-containing protein
VASRHVAAALDGLPLAPFSGRAFRHQAVEWQYSQPGAGARTVGGRWNPPNSFATLYLALSVDAAAAELHRLAARAGRRVDDFMPRHLLELDIKLGALLDLTDEKALDAVGLTEAHLHADDPALCQEVGEVAHHLGREGILAPSATDAGTVLAVFVERLLPESRFTVVSTSVWESGQDSTEADKRR